MTSDIHTLKELKRNIRRNYNLYLCNKRFELNHLHGVAKKFKINLDMFNPDGYIINRLTLDIPSIEIFNYNTKQTITAKFISNLEDNKLRYIHIKKDSEFMKSESLESIYSSDYIKRKIELNIKNVPLEIEIERNADNDYMCLVKYDNYVVDMTYYILKKINNKSLRYTTLEEIEKIILENKDDIHFTVVYLKVQSHQPTILTDEEYARLMKKFDDKYHKDDNFTKEKIKELTNTVFEKYDIKSLLY